MGVSRLSQADVSLDAADMVEKMHRAWMKSAVLHITLWSRPYVREGLW
jgi:hypothetical protein